MSTTAEQATNPPTEETAAFHDRHGDEPDLRWRILKTLGSFRILIAAALVVLYYVGGEAERVFGSESRLFAPVAIAFLVFSILVYTALHRRWWPAAIQASAPLVVDIVATVSLMHMSGGISSGLGGLLIVFVGVSSLALPGQWAAVFAALSTFAILGEQFVVELRGGDAGFPAAGLLGAIIFMMAFAAQTLTRRMEASEALARQRGVDLRNLSALNEYIVQHLRESILVIDADDEIRLANASAARLLGKRPGMADTPLDDVSAQLGDYIRRWRLDASLASHPELTLTGDNAGMRIKAHLAPLVKDGERGGPILVFLEDSSLMNERVQQSKLASLGRLSASIAHEIRNPVGAMSHAAQLLAESEGLANDDKRLTDIIQSNSERVSMIIENVLQLSRRESSQPERLEIAPWLEDFSSEFTRTLELQEGELSVHAVDSNLSVRMDRSHLRQVMWNLCDNAVKYASETGGIHVEIRAGRLDGRDRPYLEVLDSGRGIDPAMADKIFEPFFTARQGGTGLGLYISRELCELNRATLLHLDRDGGGSIFRIVFADPDRWGNQDLS